MIPCEIGELLNLPKSLWVWAVIFALPDPPWDGAVILALPDPLWVGFG